MYNYVEAVTNAVKEYIKEEFEEKKFTREELEQEKNIYDNCFISDYVTGNASGSFFCNSYKALECLFGNEELIYDVKDEFGLDESKMYDWEYLDVSIRCYVLGEAIGEALEELEEENFFKDEEEE